MNDYRSAICQYIDGHREEMLEKWKQLVNLEGRYDEKEKVEKAQDWLKKEMEAIGFRCWTVPSRPDRCSVLLGVLGENRAGRPIVFGGHIDTVHAAGSFGKENPFYIEEGKAYGPGVLDMKGGIIIALYVVKALNDVGYDKRPIKFVFAGEEEADHVGTDVDLLFTEESKGALCAFNMETGHISNSLCVGRKTQYTFLATVRGKGGHAGNEFTTGHNALHEGILKLADLIQLTNLDKGTTVTASFIQSGSDKNTSSIPDLCKFGVDVRITNKKEGDSIREKFDEIMTRTYVPGTTTEYELVMAKLHEFEPNEQILAFLGIVNKTAEESGFKPFGQITLGGATDTGSIVLAGIPALCSCGVIGEFNHNKKEYAVVESLFDRAKIYALTLIALNEVEQFS